MIEVERKQAFLEKLKRVTVYHEIRGLMARAAEAYSDRDKEACKSFFALEEPEVWIEYADEGKFEGKEAVNYIIKWLLDDEVGPQEYADVYLTTPVIEIASDGNTAKGVWWCPIPLTAHKGDDVPHAIWAWGNIAVDFILTDREWRIWHLHYFRLFKCKYEDGWVDDLSMINRLNTPALPFSQPTTYHNPYSPLSIRDGIPAGPRPYKSYTDESWMTETRKDV